MDKWADIYQKQRCSLKKKGRAMMEKGQTVFLETFVRSRGKRPTDFLEGEITVAGRKYYTVKVKGAYQEIQFDKETLREKTKYSPRYRLFPSKQALLDNREKIELLLEIRKNFEAWCQSGTSDKLSLDQLRVMKKIIDEGTIV